MRPGHLALWFLESGDESSALEWLERAVDQRDPTILFFRYDRRWDRLRSDPRYRTVMDRAGLIAAS